MSRFTFSRRSIVQSFRKIQPSKVVAIRDHLMLVPKSKLKNKTLGEPREIPFYLLRHLVSTS